MRRLCILTILSLVVLAAPAAAAAPPGEHSPNLTFVKNLQYAPDNGGTPNYGTDIEFATIAGKRYALAGSYKNGMQIVDITRPGQASIVSTYDCGVTQGDVQVFRQATCPVARSSRTRRTRSATARRRATRRPPRWASTCARTTAPAATARSSRRSPIR